MVKLILALGDVPEVAVVTVPAAALAVWEIFPHTRQSEMRDENIAYKSSKTNENINCLIVFFQIC